MKKLTSLLSALFLCWGANAQWTQLTELSGTGRNHPVTFSINGQGYVFTGYNTAFYNFFDDGYKYDPVSDTWTTLNDFPGGERGFAYGAAFNGKGYAGFGANAISRFNDLWEYDPNTDSWTELSSCPCTPRRHPAFVITDNGKLYVGLGDGYDDQGVYNSGLDDFWVYDIDSDTWSQLPDLPGSGRHHPYYFAIGNDVYVGFGHKSNNIFNDFYKLDGATQQWQQLNDFPGEERVAGTQFSHNGYGYILDGEGVDHQNLNEGEFYRYNPANDSWTAMPFHVGDGLWAPGTFVIGDMLYLTGGDLHNDQSLQTLWAYNLDENRLNDGIIEQNAFLMIDPNYYAQDVTYQWITCNNYIIPSVTTPDIPAYPGDSYKLVVNYSKGGIDTSDCIVATNITAIEQKEAISIYPNPAQNSVQITAETGTYTLYNSLGIVIRIGVVQPSERINIQDLPQGQYYIQYADQKGSAPQTLTFIKQ